MARISRRRLFKLSGGGAVAAKTGGIAAILAPRRERAGLASTLLGIALAVLSWCAAVRAAEETTPEARQAAAPGAVSRLTPQLFDAIVRLHAQVPLEARTASYLGTEREGAGTVIDGDGLIVTIGYLVTEAMAIEVTPSSGKALAATLVGLDSDSGLALVRAAAPLGVKPIALGHSAELAEHQPVLILSYGGPSAAQFAEVVSRRSFAGYWEYLLDDAIFTVPPDLQWSGAALVGSDGRLLGVGSLIVRDAVPGAAQPGNMFVPIDRLRASMADLLSLGRPGGPPRPWLGINAQEIDGKIVVTRVSPDSPAQRAGVTHGSVVSAVAGQRVSDLAGFYRRVWSQGSAGVEVPLTIEQNGATREVGIKTMSRYDYLKLDTTY